MTDDAPGKQQLLKFPCNFPLKVMGRDHSRFRDTVVNTVNTYTGPVDDSDIREVISSKGNYVSLTIIVHVNSQQQLDSIYRDLTDCEDVLFSL